MISKGLTGITIRCSTVPCSRSRIKAAPVSSTERIVMLFMTCITEVNHRESPFGLNLALIARLMGGVTLLTPLTA